MAVPSLSGTPEQWKRVRDAVVARRNSRRPRLTQAALGQAAGISTATVQTLEAAKPPEAMAIATLESISVALGWTPDSIARLLGGADPIEAEGVSAETLADRLDRYEAEQSTISRSLAELAEGLEALTQRLNALQPAQSPADPSVHPGQPT